MCFFGGNSSKEDLYIEPTLLDNITNDNKIMKEEIFGPICLLLLMIISMKYLKSSKVNQNH